jgi:hypothetical protein
MKVVPLHVLAATRTAVTDSPSSAKRLSLASRWLAPAAAIVWTAAWIAWAFVHLPILLKAPADRGPG